MENTPSVMSVFVAVYPVTPSTKVERAFAIATTSSPVPTVRSIFVTGFTPSSIVSIHLSPFTAVPSNATNADVYRVANLPLPSLIRSESFVATWERVSGVGMVVPDCAFAV